MYYLVMSLMTPSPIIPTRIRARPHDHLSAAPARPSVRGRGMVTVADPALMTRTIVWVGACSGEIPGESQLDDSVGD